MWSLEREKGLVPYSNGWLFTGHTEKDGIMTIFIEAIDIFCRRGKISILDEDGYIPLFSDFPNSPLLLDQICLIGFDEDSESNLYKALKKIERANLGFPSLRRAIIQERKRWHEMLFNQLPPVILERTLWQVSVNADWRKILCYVAHCCCKPVEQYWTPAYSVVVFKTPNGVFEVHPYADDPYQLQSWVREAMFYYLES